MWQKRGPALLCLLLATALTVFAAARSPAAPPGEVPPPQTLEEESLLYEETPVQIISLLDLEPVDTRASANPVRVGGGTLDPVDQAEMASVLAECTLKDNTIVRLYVTAEGLIDGAFLRPGAGWIRFARLYRGADQGPNYAETAALTACSGILGHDGFLLRTDGHCSGVYSYDYYWFDTAGDLQVLTARMDPVALDQACADACGKQSPIPGSHLDEQMHREGFCDKHDHFINSMPDTDWRVCLDHCEKIGIGTRSYELVEVK